MYTFSNHLMNEDQTIAGTFSSSWAAVAAMLRLSNPKFKSLCGDAVEDLEIEKNLKLT